MTREPGRLWHAFGWILAWAFFAFCASVDYAAVTYCRVFGHLPVWCHEANLFYCERCSRTQNPHDVLGRWR